MEFKTVEQWDEEVWGKWREVYYEAFGETKAKPEKIILNMFRKQMCFFHIVQNKSEVQAIALSGKLQGTRMLLIDYLAVREKDRNQGIGRMMMEYMKTWSTSTRKFESIVIEVEAEKTSKNLARIRFWEKCGFTLTEYIHHYRVVPEPYQAMFIKLVSEAYCRRKGKRCLPSLSDFIKSLFEVLKFYFHLL